MPKKPRKRAAPAAKKEHLHVLSLGLALGILLAAIMFITGAFAMTSGWWPQSFMLMSEWYLGFSPTPTGVILGTIYGFIDGFVGGALIAWLYNEIREELK